MPDDDDEARPTTPLPPPPRPVRIVSELELSPAFQRELRAYADMARALESLSPPRRARAVLLCALSVVPRALDNLTLAGLVEAAKQPEPPDDVARDRAAVARVRELATLGGLDDRAAALVLAALDG